MGVTYVSGTVRDIGFMRPWPVDSPRGPVWLALTSTVVILAMALSYRRAPQGTCLWPVLATSRKSHKPQCVAHSRELEPSLDWLFPNERGPSFCSRTSFEFVILNDAADRLPNVGAILRASVSVDTINRTPRLIEYKARLRDALAAQQEPEVLRRPLCLFLLPPILQLSNRRWP